MTVLQKLKICGWWYSCQSYLLYLYTLVQAVTVEFESRNVTVNEGDGTVTVNLVRSGSASGSVTIYISVTRDKLTAIHKRMYILYCLPYCIISKLSIYQLYCVSFHCGFKKDLLPFCLSKANCIIKIDIKGQQIFSFLSQCWLVLYL